MLPVRPRLLPVEVVEVGPKEEFLLGLRDAAGFGHFVVLPYGAVVLALLTDGQRTLAQIQEVYRRQTGVPVALRDVEEILRRLDCAYLLAGERYEEYRREQIETYLGNPVRPAWHAGGAYPEKPDVLRKQLAGFFAAAGEGGVCGAGVSPAQEEHGQDARTPRLRGLLSPHIDPHRGGPAYARAYRQVAERCDADLFVVLGTAHRPMEEYFCVSSKEFETPLGVVPNDPAFVERLAGHLASSLAGRQIDLRAGELAHRQEHSIEFQAVWLQYVLGGRRAFRMVPVLCGSLHELIAGGTSPDDSPEIQAFVAALRAACAGHAGRACLVGAVDFAHIGPRFGDEWLVDAERLARQAGDDKYLLDAVCRADAAEFFHRVAEQDDRGRICGLAPTYTLLAAMGPARGELLGYDQAVEGDGSACVSYAGVAFWEP